MFPAINRGATSSSVRLYLRTIARPNHWYLFALGIPLGIILSAALQTHPVSPATQDTSIRSVSADTILRLEDEQRSLKDSIKSLREQVVAAQRDEAARRTQLSGLSNQLDKLKINAGLTNMQGPGVRVTLDDSQLRTVPPGIDPNLLLVHDYDLRDTVALLWASGAEAIDINGQRLVDTTSIYCVGSTILVNDTRLSPPYAIEAIGPGSMQAAVNAPSALAQLKSVAFQYGLGLKTTTVDDLTVPSFDGLLTPHYSAAAVN